MNRSNELRLRVLSDLVKTLNIAGEDVIIKPDDFSGVVWGGENCIFYMHKTYRKKGHTFYPIEYATDTHVDMMMSHFVVLTDAYNTNVFYKIPTKKLFDTINWGIVNDTQHFHIVDSKDILKNHGLCVDVEMDTLISIPGTKEFNLSTMKDGFVQKYNCLINKLVNQYFSKNTMSWDQIQSMALEGFAIALNTYDRQRSNMSFTKYAAFAIRNNILSSLDNELRTVKLSNYAQKKALESGDALFNTVRLDHVSNTDKEEHRQSGELKIGAYTKAKFDDGDVFEYLYSRIEEQFPPRDVEMFYKVFGLNGFDETKGKDVAIMMGVSEGLVSQKIKKITTWIRQDNEICEMLQNLVS